MVRQSLSALPVSDDNGLWIGNSVKPECMIDCIVPIGVVRFAVSRDRATRYITKASRLGKGQRLGTFQVEVLPKTHSAGYAY